MAVSISISNHTLFSPRSSASFSSSNHHQLLLIHSAPHRAALTSRSLGFPLPNCAPLRVNRRRPSLRLTPAANAAAADGSDVENDGETLESEDGQSQLPSLSALIDAYKEALLSGDEEMLFEIEGKICKLEMKKQELVKKLSSLSAEVSSEKEKYIRLQADWDNFRKRSDKEKLSLTGNAQREIIESLLSVVDIFDKEKRQINPETDKEKKIDTSYQGIYKQLVEVMRSWHVSAVATVGKPFDPSLHEAVARETSQEFKEGIVIRELQRGFLLKDQLLRPAKVKVSSGPGGKKTETATLESAGIDER